MAGARRQAHPHPARRWPARYIDVGLVGITLQRDKHAGPERLLGIADSHPDLADEDAVAIDLHPAVRSADQDADRALRGLLRLPEEIARQFCRRKRLPAGVEIDRRREARMDDLPAPNARWR